MLCDLLREGAHQLLAEQWQIDQGQGVGDAYFACATMERIAAEAERLVLSPQIRDLISGLSLDEEAIRRQQKHVRAPHPLTWIEWHGRTPINGHEARQGVLVDVPDPTKPLEGEVVWFIPDASRGDGYTAVTWDLRIVDRETADEKIRSGHANMATAVIQSSRAKPGRLELIEPGISWHWLVALLAVLSTPRLTALQPQDVTKINKARANSGGRKPPLLSWSEVTLRRDLATGAPVATARTGAGAEGDGTGRHGVAYHSVRGHWRLRRGQVELVRPHHRGDRAFGEIRHRYVVRAPGEPVGSWRGDLPAATGDVA